VNKELLLLLLQSGIIK